MSPSAAEHVRAHQRKVPALHLNLRSFDSELEISDSAANDVCHLRFVRASQRVLRCRYFEINCDHPIQSWRIPIQRQTVSCRLHGRQRGCPQGERGSMARQPDEKRLTRQRQRQRELRSQNAAAKRPGRDDVARTVLFWTIRDIARQGTSDVLDQFLNRTVRMLVEQGFDERACEEVLDELVAKYKTGKSPFRRKIHLLYPDGPPVDEPSAED